MTASLHSFILSYQRLAVPYYHTSAPESTGAPAWCESAGPGSAGHVGQAGLVGLGDGCGDVAGELLLRGAEHEAQSDAGDAGEVSQHGLLVEGVVGLGVGLDLQQRGTRLHQRVDVVRSELDVRVQLVGLCHCRVLSCVQRGSVPYRARHWSRRRRTSASASFLRRLAEVPAARAEASSASARAMSSTYS